MILEAAIFLATFLVLLVIFHRKSSNLPPGEWGYPVIGYLPPKGERVPDMVKRLHAKHGKIFCAKFGTILLVYLSDHATIKSAFGKHEFSGRPNFFTWKILYFSKSMGVALNSGIVWDTNRKFAIKVLKDFGMGKSKLEESVNIEVDTLVKDLRRKFGKPIKIDWSLNAAILNVIWTLVADKRYEHGDQEIHDFSEMVDQNVESLSGPAVIFDFYPWLVPITPNFVRKLLKVDHIERNRDKLFAYFRKIIDEHVSTVDKNNIRDYIDMYLIEMENQKEDPTSSTFERNLLDLSASICDIFIAGSETTSNTIRWYFLYMAKYPEIQKKVQEEIDSVVPKERYPSLEDKNKLPYFEATTYELQRKISLLPLGVPHAATEDGFIDGYKIPKGTTIFSSIGVCQQSSEYWDRPNEFYPEHFLNEEGKFYIRKEGFLPFSLGRRQCLGESLAKMELFLFLGAIIQNFTISEPKGQNVTLEPYQGPNIINKAQPFEVLLTQRNPETAS